MSVTETVTPSVRGLRKLGVAVLLVGAATATGALAGFASGIALGWVDDPAPSAVVVVVAAALAADAARLRPVGVRSQVPRIWGELFAPTTVALLYGARLGVGPLTILRTWLWWAAAVLAALQGPFAAALSGAVFGVARTVLMVAVAQWARAAMAPRMARLQTQEARIAFAAGVLLIAGAALGLR